MEYVIELARRAGVPHLILFHHDPNRGDDELDLLLDKYRARVDGKLRLDAAVQGSVIDLPS
jgi:ribonuclease BN (tRNA processing enzyme)